MIFDYRERICFQMYSHSAAIQSKPRLISVDWCSIVRHYPALSGGRNRAACNLNTSAPALLYLPTPSLWVIALTCDYVSYLLSKRLLSPLTSSSDVQLFRKVFTISVHVEQSNTDLMVFVSDSLGWCLLSVVTLWLMYAPETPVFIKLSLRK